MSVLEKLASQMGRRDEVPNQELAAQLAETENKKDIQEIAENLFHKDKNIQNDCIKVLYEVGYHRPELIVPYAENFIKLLYSKNNRMVWGAMIALTTVAVQRADLVFDNLQIMEKSLKEGSVIVMDNAVRVLALTASVNKEYEKKIFPMLLEHLWICRPKEVCQHGESILPAVNMGNQEDFLEVLRGREQSLSAAQITRLKKIYKNLHGK